MAKENNFHHTETEISEGFGSWHLPLIYDTRQRHTGALMRRSVATSSARRPGTDVDPANEYSFQQRSAGRSREAGAGMFAFTSFEIFLKNGDARAASLNTLPRSAARCRPHEASCRFTQTNYVQGKTLTSLPCNLSQGKLHSLVARLQQL